MAHNDYLKPGGVWGLFSVFTSALAAQMDQYLFQSINGDLGGVWAPIGVITIGGLGMQVFGPFTATDAQITIPSGKFISVFTGGTVVMNPGSLFSMLGTMKVEFGGNVWVYGPSQVQFYQAGGNPSGAIFNTNTAIVLLAGSSMTLASGAQIAFGTSSLISGSPTIHAASVWTWGAGATMQGTYTAQNLTVIGINYVIQGTTQIQGVGLTRAKLQVGNLADVEYVSGSRIIGTVTRTASELRSGTGSWTARRPPTTGPDANTTINTTASDVTLVPTLNADRTWILADPGTSGMVYHTIKRHSAGAPKLFITDTDGATKIGQFDGTGISSLTFAWNGSNWFSLTWATYTGVNGWVTI